ncbi:ACP S-malonyltransferase [Streptomyces sp. XM4193]|uniref:ACP S-malonyltransferase n=1 Tax=Streptomyces sp. XM4193 TaxID=2929782 RepID=UPI001FFAFD27|nr:ACP S-malonyltransferase [Streptomyces sp. XM4193]MCK1796087.1 ACP S-malonyltransferase [Streptomyces sp. XM4193]
MLVLVAPGQGAQTPGFLSPWLELPGVADRLGAWSDAIELDLVHFGTEGTAEEILDTSVAQPLLVAAGLISARALRESDESSGPVRIGAVAGHSVGELTAAAVAGVLSEEEALRVVRRRGLAMAEAAAKVRTGMAAVLGGDQDEVVAHLEKLGLTPANVNGAGQIVAAGTVEQLEALKADKPAGARVVAVKVAGAFHTEHMAPAVESLRQAVEELSPRPASIPLVSNRDGRLLTDGAEFIERLVAQVANPVRWDLCMETFAAQGATALIELCPAGTLAGIARRAMPEVARGTLKTPADLAAAHALAVEHGIEDGTAGQDGAVGQEGTTV